MDESLVKYLAGLLDADGSLSFGFRRSDFKQDVFHVQLSLRLTASDEVDHDRFVENLPKLTGFGTTSRYGRLSQFCAWSVSKRADLEMLLPRVIKHMVIKGRHWQWILDTWRDLRSVPRANDGQWSVSDVERTALTEASKHSRRLRVGPVRQKNRPTWAWLAGYLDGDGWYTLRYDKQQNYWAMRVAAVAHNNDASVLDFIQNAFGGSIKVHTTPTCKVWYRNVGIRDSAFARRFLGKLVRHSRLKRHKIEMMIHHHQQRLSDSAPTGEATV